MHPRILFYSLFVGANFGFVMFLQAVIPLTLHTALNDCARQGTESACLSPAISTTTCRWLASNSTCVFADYQELNCSTYNTSSSCVTAAGGSSCRFDHLARSCKHAAGFSNTESGLFAGASIAGGAFSSVLMQKIAEWFAASTYSLSCASVSANVKKTERIRQGQLLVVFLNGGVTLLAAILFSIGIDVGDKSAQLALFIVSKLLASVGSFSGAFLLPALVRSLRDNDNAEAVLMTRAMGTQIGTAAMLGSIYFYFSMPRGTLYLQDENFSGRLHGLNGATYVIGGIFTVWAAIETWWPEFCGADVDCSCSSSSADEKERGKEPIETATATESTATAVAVSDAAVIIGAVDSSEAAKQDDEESPSSTSEEDVEMTTEQQQPEQQEMMKPQEETQQHKQQQEQQAEQPPPAPPCCDREEFLSWLAGILCPIVQQSSGLFAVAPFVTVIVADTIEDAFLAQLLFSVFVCLGALSGFALILCMPSLKPLYIFFVTAFFCAVADALIGVALYPNAGVGRPDVLALFAVLLFGFAFGMGPSSLFFASLLNVYPPPMKASGSAFSGVFTAAYQSVWRVAFPPMVAALSTDVRVARALVFFGCGVVTLLALVALLIVVRTKQYVG